MGVLINKLVDIKPVFDSLLCKRVYFGLVHGAPTPTTPIRQSSIANKQFYFMLATPSRQLAAWVFRSSSPSGRPRRSRVALPRPLFIDSMKWGRVRSYRLALFSRSLLVVVDQYIGRPIKSSDICVFYVYRNGRLLFWYRPISFFLYYFLA